MPVAQTKDQILDAAERLFADRGVGATSLRSIMARAEVNSAAVHYHFGGKEGLLAAVIHRRLEPVTEERLRRLDALERGAEPPTLEALVEAYVEPALRLAGDSDRGARFMQLLGHVHHEADEAARACVKQLLKPVISRFAAAFRCAVPAVDPVALAWRTHFAIGAMAHTMACREYVNWIDEDADGVDAGRVMRELVAFAAAGLRASVPSAGREGAA